jgi:hypothetical protein
MPYSNPDANRAYHRAYYHAHKEKMREQNREWKAKNPERVKASNRQFTARNRARLREVNRLAQIAARKPLQERVWAIKVERGCADCGFNANPVALQFDHLDRTKKVAGIGQLITKCAPWPEILAEIDKCDVVCANCHAIRTYNGKHWQPVGQMSSSECQEALFDVGEGSA